MIDRIEWAEGMLSPPPLISSDGVTKRKKKFQDWEVDYIMNRIRNANIATDADRLLIESNRVLDEVNQILDRFVIEKNLVSVSPNWVCGFNGEF